MNTTSVVAAVSRNAGGLQNSVRRLHQCLNELPGVSVRIVSLLDGHSTEDIPEWLPLPVKVFPVVGPRAFGFSPGMNSALQADDAVIMHTHGIWQYPSVAVHNWHRTTKRPYLISPHGMLDPWAVRHSAWKKRLALTFYERRHLESAACIRALCQAEADAIRLFGLKNPICIIPNGIDLPLDHNPLTSDLRSQSSGRKTLLYLGRIHPKKGLVNLLHAWKQTLNSQPLTRNSWTLAIAGWDQGGHEDELKRLATELGIPWADVRAAPSPRWREGDRRPDEVTDTPSAILHSPSSLLFLGPQFGDAKAACYKNCDAFILPSFSEGLPMVVLEAWAYGKPVLMTPECNLPEGFTANAAIRMDPNAESIGAGLEKLVRLPSSELCSLGAQGRELVATRFTWPKIAVDLKSVYDWILGLRPKPECVIN